jgi:hypothetical protein
VTARPNRSGKGGPAEGHGRNTPAPRQTPHAPDSFTNEGIYHGDGIKAGDCSCASGARAGVSGQILRVDSSAYGLATSFWETGQKMQPVQEIGRGRGYPYGKPGKHGGQIAYGRGDVQLTWDYNYERADNELGLKGALTSNYDRALETEISAQIMVIGMTEGWFTGRKFSSYLPKKGLATLPQFTSARRIINGIDRAEKVAGLAMSFQAALVAGGWT